MQQCSGISQGWRSCYFSHQYFLIINIVVIIFNLRSKLLFLCGYLLPQGMIILPGQWILLYLRNFPLYFYYAT